MAPADVEAAIAKLAAPPPPGSPYALPVPGTERENRTPVYRHWRFRDGPLLETFEPSVRTLHDIFESSAKHRANKPFLGWRPWDPATKTWEPKYVWMTYAEAAERRKNLGAGIVELHQRIGVTAEKYGVGLWAQNRPEWELTGNVGVRPQALAPPTANVHTSTDPPHLQSLPSSPSPSGPFRCTRLLDQKLASIS